MKAKVIFTYHDIENNLATERLWAEKEGEFYRIKNIPFSFPNIAYDDLVDVEIDEGELFFDKLIEKSGNSTIQIIVFNNIDIATITTQIEAMQCGWEGSHLKGYISVNVPKEVDYILLRHFLDGKREENILDYSEACLAHKI